MLSHQAKAFFYLAAGPLLALNGFFYRHFRAPRTGPAKVHLGPGQRNYLPGWVNVDANMFTGKCDLWADLRNPLPFHTASLDAAYSHHMLEHLPNLEQHLAEVFRCLKPGGVYRVGGPNGDSAMAKFLANDTAWFGDFPDKYTSIGGRFANFIFCRQEHLTILTYSFLEELMSNAGFTHIRASAPAQHTGYPQLFSDCLSREDESDFDAPHTLLVEGVKPPVGR